MVTVTNSSGCQAISSPTTVIVNPLPTTTITGSTTVCSGSSSILNAGAGFASYHWSTNASTQTISVNSAGTYSVTVTNASNCTGIASVIVTVGSGLTPSISGSSILCSGTSSVLNAGSGYSTYHWSTNGTTQSISISSAGVYSVTVTNSNGCSGSASITITSPTSPTPTVTGISAICIGSNSNFNSGSGFSSYSWSTGATTQSISVSIAGTYNVTVTNSSGCSGAATKTLTVNSNPSPIITGASNICSGTNATLNGGAGFSSYHWSTNATTQTITVNSANTYSITVTNSSGCSGTDSKSINVNPAPNPVITGASTICGGASTVLHAGAGYSSYLWSTGSTNQNISVSTANTYYVTVTNSLGCSGVNSKVVTVGSIPNPVISSNGLTSICQGSFATLVADSGYASYNWSNGSSLSSISVNDSGIFSVVVSDVNGSTGLSNTISVTVNDTPICSGWIQPSEICSGDAAYISIDGDTSWNYLWNPGLMTGMTLTVIPPVSTTYVLTATNSSNCTTTFSLPITVNPVPFTPAIIQSGSVLIAMANNALSYQWYFNGVSISGATDMIYNPGQQYGNYSVIISNDFGCEAQSVPYGYYGVGISNVVSSDIVIYPNPFLDYIEVENLDGKNEIKIFDIQGKAVYQTLNSENIEMINTSELSAGFYLLRIITESKIINKVLVKN